MRAESSGESRIVTIRSKFLFASMQHHQIEGHRFLVLMPDEIPGQYDNLRAGLEESIQMSRPEIAGWSPEIADFAEYQSEKHERKQGEA